MNTVFLDRDGVINRDLGYVHRWEDFHFLDGSIEALKILTKKNIPIIIITNQSGIARGYFSEQQYNDLMKKFKSVCAELEINILDVFYCPHHPEAKIRKYKISCDCRKPKPGMIFKAFEKHNLFSKNCYLVGDRLSDLKAGYKAGIQDLILIKSNVNSSKFQAKFNFQVKYSLYDWVKSLDL
jgi:D-glycero-D-manno-heptose 1,7-bisphosphate phosphatase